MKLTNNCFAIFREKIRRKWVMQTSYINKNYIMRNYPTKNEVGKHVKETFSSRNKKKTKNEEEQQRHKCYINN